MHPLKELRRIINNSNPNQGKLVKVSDNELTIVTPKGMVSTTQLPGDATRYRVGDSVILANGVVVGRHSLQPTVYVL